MPYLSVDDLPPAVKRLPRDERIAFMQAFNNMYAKGANEEQCFMIAWGAARKVRRRKSRREMDRTREAEWTREFINDLPDAAFAYIEPGGRKDSTGRTVPRSLRHFPHHGPDVKNGTENDSVDIPHLRNALARAAQSPFGPRAIRHLRAHAKALGVGEVESR